MELLFDREEREEVDQLLTWWNRYVYPFIGFHIVLMKMNRQVFPLYADIERLPSKNSALARIRQKRAENREQDREGPE